MYKAIALIFICCFYYSLVNGFQLCTTSSLSTSSSTSSSSLYKLKKLYSIKEPSTLTSVDINNDIIKKQLESSSSSLLSISSRKTRKVYNPTKRLLRTGGVSSYNNNKNNNSNNVNNGAKNTDKVKEILELIKQRSFNPDDVVIACRNLESNNNNNHSISISLKEYNIIIKALGDRGNLNNCDEILSLMLENNIKPSVITYSTLISRAASWQKIQKAEFYFKKMQNDGIIPDVQAYNSLINAYAKSGDTNRALDVVNSMDKSNIHPNVVTFNTLIDSCARSRNIIKAQEIFEMMNNRGIDPNERSYISLVHVLCEAGSLDAAIKLVEILKDKFSFNFPSVIYSILLHFLGKEGDIQRAFEIISNMKSKGVVPNVVTFTSLVHACGRHGKLDLAFEIYKEMTKSPKPEDRPNSITCSSLADACLKAGEVDKAFAVIIDMKNLGIKLTEVTYTSLISELTRLKQLDRILEVFLNEQDEEAPIPIKRKGKPMFPTSSQTLSLGSTDISNDMEKDLPNLSNRSMVLLRDILESLPNLDSRVGGAILTILRLTEFLDAALTVSKSDEEISDADRYLIVKSVENAKDIDRFATFIYDNLPNDQDKGIYSQVYQLIEQTCEKRNIILSYYQTISTLDDTNTVTNSNNEIPFFNEKISQNYSTIISEYEAIKEKGGMPGEGLYKSLLQTIAQKSKIESSSSDNEYESRQQRHNELFRLYLVFQEMRTAGIQPDAATYNTLIHACTGAGDLEKAFEAIQEMQADGLAPDVITYTSLIKACGISLGPKAVAASEEIFDTMQQRTNHFSTYTEPNELTFKYLIQVHVEAIKYDNKVMNTKRIWTLFDDIFNRGMIPSMSTLKYCMQAALYTNDVDKALKIIDIAKAKKKYDYYMWSTATNILNKYNSNNNLTQLRFEEDQLRFEISERRSSMI